MKITETKVYPSRDGKLKAFASVVIDGCFIIRDLKVVQGPNGLFVSMPARKTGEGSYRDIVHPLDAQTRQYVEKTILDEYEKLNRE